MSSLLCLLCPSIISIRMYMHLCKEKIYWQFIVLNYFLFLFFNHLLSTFFSFLFFGARDSVVHAIDVFPFFAVKYCVVSTIFSIILPIVFRIIESNIDYRLEVIKVEKKVKNRKKTR